MIQLVVGLGVAGGILVMGYRIYLAFAAGKEARIETENTIKLTKDEAKDAQDEQAVKNSNDQFNNAVSKFDDDSKS